MINILNEMQVWIGRKRDFPGHLLLYTEKITVEALKGIEEDANVREWLIKGGRLENDQVMILKPINQLISKYINKPFLFNNKLLI